MAAATAYRRPAGTARAEHHVRKSRFVAVVGPAGDRSAATAFVEERRREHPGAHHVCHAFVAGDPRGDPEMGSGDDGEPGGTAGRPILGVLEHHGLGDVVAVVARYFGGVKLGAGGLVRAYSTAAQRALESLPVETWEPTRRMRLTFDFPLESRVRRLAEERRVALGEPDYGERVSVTAEPPESVADEFARALTEAAQGRIEIGVDAED